MKLLDSVFKDIVEAHIEARRLKNASRHSNLCTTLKKHLPCPWGIRPRHAFRTFICLEAYISLEQNSLQKRKPNKVNEAEPRGQKSKVTNKETSMLVCGIEA